MSNKQIFTSLLHCIQLLQISNKFKIESKNIFELNFFLYNNNML
jgi:hypothetical protein